MKRATLHQLISETIQLCKSRKYDFAPNIIHGEVDFDSLPRKRRSLVDSALAYLANTVSGT